MIPLITSALGLAAEVLAVLLLLGFGLTTLMLPERPGRALLLAPVVGLAAANLTCQWLTWVAPAPVALGVALATLGSLTLVVGWRSRHLLVESIHLRPVALLLVGLMIIGYLGTLAFALSWGEFTLTGLPSDPIQLYLPSAEWYRAHPFLPGQPLPVTSQLVGYLDLASKAYPGSVGTLDAGFSALTGWPVHALFNPFDAVLLAMVGLATFLLATCGLQLSRMTGLTATGLVFLSPLMAWSVGSGYQQELEALALLYAGLAVLCSGRREGFALGRWLLVAVLFAPLPGVYLPAVALGAVLLAPTSMLAVARLLKRRPPLGWGAAIAAGTMVALSAPALYWLVMRGGLAVWHVWTTPAAPARDIFAIYSVSELAGTTPISFALTHLPLALWQPSWHGAARFGALLVAGLILAGCAALVSRRHWLEAAAAGCALVYLGWLALIVAFPYGLVKAVAYLTPMWACLAAAGVAWAISVVREAAPPGQRRVRLLWMSTTVLPATVLALVVVLQSISWAEMEIAIAGTQPSMPPSSADIASVVTLVPPRARVLLFDPTDKSVAGPVAFYRYETAAYFLAGYANTRMVVAGPPSSNGPGPPYYYYEFVPEPPGQLPNTAGWDFVLTAPSLAGRLPPDFRPVWTRADLDLSLFQRVVPRLASSVLRTRAATEPVPGGSMARPVQLTIRNVGSQTWPGGGAYPILLGYRILRASDGQVVTGLDTAWVSQLTDPVAPGQSITISPPVWIPSQPGSYRIEWMIKQESGQWSELGGGRAGESRIRVGGGPASRA